MTAGDMIHEVERLTIADDEVLVIRPKNRVLTRHEQEVLHSNLNRIATKLGWDQDRIVVLERDIDMTIVKAEQARLL